MKVTKRELLRRIEALEEWRDYADEMLTDLNHALPDPEHDAKCAENAVAVEESLDRHAVRLGLKKPKLKQLDQSVFDGLDEQWQWAAFGNDGCRHVYLEKPRCGSYWEHSLIKRESKELTGSDLALELLKNQRYIIASVSDKSDADAIECGNNKLIHKSSEDIFTDDMGGIYCWAVALNNQGEPLTAADVGL